MLFSGERWWGVHKTQEADFLKNRREVLKSFSHFVGSSFFEGRVGFFVFILLCNSLVSEMGQISYKIIPCWDEILKSERQMRVENVDDSVIWSETVYQTLDVIYGLSVFYV